jgi:hypothetical protein
MCLKARAKSSAGKPIVGTMTFPNTYQSHAATLVLTRQETRPEAIIIRSNSLLLVLKGNPCVIFNKQHSIPHPQHTKPFCPFVSLSI